MADSPSSGTPPRTRSRRIASLALLALSAGALALLLAQLADAGADPWRGCWAIWLGPLSLGLCLGAVLLSRGPMRVSASAFLGVALLASSFLSYRAARRCSLREWMPGRAAAAEQATQEPEAFPLVEGDYQMTPDWRITLPRPFRRRVERGSLVLWRPGLTVWVSAWSGPGEGDSARERLRQVQATASPARFGEIEEASGDLLRWAYRLEEPADDRRVPALYGFVLRRSSHVQLGIYFDREEDVGAAHALWRSVR